MVCVPLKKIIIDAYIYMYINNDLFFRKSQRKCIRFDSPLYVDEYFYCSN